MRLNVPEVTDVQIAFSTLKTDKKLLSIARERGFYDSNTIYNTLFSQLFFRGGSIVIRDGVDKEYAGKILRYLKAFMRSFEPKHEEKEAISALLLSEIAETKTPH